MSSPCLYDPLLVAQMVENLHAMQETQVRSLGREDPLEKGECLPTPGFLSGEVRGQRSLTGYSPGGLKESDMTEQLTHYYNLLPHLLLAYSLTLSSLSKTWKDFLFPFPPSKP